MPPEPMTKTFASWILAKVSAPKEALALLQRVLGGAAEG